MRTIIALSMGQYFKKGEVVKKIPSNRKIMNFKSLEDLEKTYILRTLKGNGWNKARTYKELGIAKSTLYLKINQYRQEGYSIK